MLTVENKSFDEERAFYGNDGITVKKCRFDGPADGESAFKESRNVVAENCFFNLRYPFWHVEKMNVSSSEMTENCRAAIWYSKDISLFNSKLYGIKALRECENVFLKSCEIASPEFGWSVRKCEMENCTVKSEYFMLRSDRLNFKNVKLDGKYSFQYISDSVFDNCEFNTKDAFWHAENVTVKNSVIRGEYLAWYSENITFENCRIIGTQPLCYCKGLRLIDCTMEKADLSFEKSAVQADIIGDIVSIKNPESGYIKALSVGEIIDDYGTSCVITVL